MAAAGQTDPSEDALLPAGLPTHGGSAEKLSPSAVNRLLMELLMYFGRAAFLLYPVYLSGYLGFSVSWVLLCMVMVTWWKKNRQWKDSRIGTAIEFVDNESQVVHKELRSALQMASWVHFPEVEKVDWVNKVLEQAWPFFGMYMEKFLKENIQPAVRLSSPALKTFAFTKIHFGNIPLKIKGMKAYTHEVDQREVVLDLDISYLGDVDIDAVVKEPITAGVKGLKLTGMLRVILEPLIGVAPLVGGVTFFFIRRPKLEINWTGATNLLDTPAFSSLSEEAIMDIIASLMVLPNRMCVPLIDQVKVDQMRFPLPRGVVRVHLLEGRDLVAKDTYMMGLVKGKSDPYATIRVGNRNVKSKTIKENLHPKWNEVYEFVIHEAPGQELELELYDEDTDKDDFMGRFNLDFGDVKQEKEMDKWFELEGVPYGEVRLKLQWLSLNADPSLLTESSDGLACAMLAVYLDSASNVPKDPDEIHKQKKQKEGQFTKRTAAPNSYVELSVDDDVQKSKVVYSSKDPAWEEGFTFFVHSVKKQQLCVQIKEHEKKTLLGTLSLPLNRLLNISNMALDQRFLLERSGANSQIKLKATLRVLSVEKPPPKAIVNPKPPQPNVAPQTNQGGQLLKPPPPVATSTPTLPTSNAVTAAHFSGTPSQNSLNGQYAASHRGSMMALDTYPTASSASTMRRFDSHSLLSENSIASSRFDVSEGAPYPEAIRRHQGSFGEIHLTIRYATLRNKLIIVVDACRNLFPCTENGTDSYARLYLLPDQSWRHRKKTHVKKRTVNPVFNEKFEFDVSLQEVQTRKLDVSVKNNKMFYSRERKDIGMVLIDFSEMDVSKGVTQWFELTLPGLKTFG
ncbi:extended synaptotagmin-3 [Takifugu rubripes]|uniref:extended synaptotagmin-3 n=1 Tax=Takifugu rubripes TaxID=31033 RepID=UPI0002989B79|nr:extended synaptotagmin-3-like [Takifugu rubripes]|eukprot:XP_003962138.1 PREDICTED: extended synaptotagmin-3-like [Takifugu rubripes]